MQILSGNLVGYANITPKDIGKISGGGSAFISVGGEGYCLKDFKIVNPGGDFGEEDFITFVQTGIAKTDDIRAYYWDTDYDAWAYMYTAGGHIASDEVPKAELEQVIPAGTGFLCNFQTASAQIAYAGEVNAGIEGKIVCGRAGRYTYIVNPNPYEISLANVKIINAGGDFGEEDYITFMQTGLSKTDDARAYYWDSDYENWAYMYTAGGHTASDEVTSPSEVKIKAGEAVLFNSQTTAARVVVDAPVLK